MYMHLQCFCMESIRIYMYLHRCICIHIDSYKFLLNCSNLGWIYVDLHGNVLKRPRQTESANTCRAVQWRRRKCLKFYERCAIRLNGGAGDHRELVRSRDLSDDGGIVFVNEDDDDSGVTGILRLRVFDFSGDDEGQASVAAAPVYCGAIRK